MLTTGILDALMQLFALFAVGRTPKEAMLGRQAANRYMSGRLSRALTDRYLNHYDQALDALNNGVSSKGFGMIGEKQLAKLSVKLLRTCTQINRELEIKDRLIVFARLSEFAKESGTMDGADSFLTNVGDCLHLNSADSRNIKALVVANQEDIPEELCQYFALPMGHDDKMTLIGCRVSLDDLFFIKYVGLGEVRLNGIPIPQSITAPMTQGSVLKDDSGHAIFFSDVLKACNQQQLNSQQVDFRALDVTHFFNYPSEPALMPLSFEASNGELIGVMGASGSGKSTLLNILNGSMRPSFGAVEINGLNIHDHPEEVIGSMGYIAQEDVLIAELSVRDNLRYSAALSFGDLDESELNDKVDITLKRLGLWGISNLRVGSIMDKTISGGQRKRLNIALELIREPQVLFVDEPTSGLSSRDSERIMDLLKELALRGKLIFVVIHQPSSDIFKLFDNLILLDNGGYPIYQGNPLNSLHYFRKLSNQANVNEAICAHCGTVNPEELFELIEARMVDEYGQLTDTRRISPAEWNDYYNLIQANEKKAVPEEWEFESVISVPSWWSQFRTYMQRDIHAKRLNRQYLLINFLEAPILALVLAGFTRFQDGQEGYVYRLSENLPQFLFIGVIVSLFLGLSVSAEEILRDRPTLRREHFLNLKWTAYLSSKVSIMFGLSAIQSALFALVSVWVLQIPNALGIWFATLFSLSCFSNLLGLSISSAFRSAKVIYILIPLLIIPQIIFGGAIVRFERFNPIFTQIDRVPWLGNIMASRWGFESIAVSLTRSNEFDAPFAAIEDRLERAAWRRDFWCDASEDLLNDSFRNREMEMARLELLEWGHDVSDADNLETLRQEFKDAYRTAFRDRDAMRRELGETMDLAAMKDRHHNDALYEWVMQTDQMKRIEETDRGLVQANAFIHQLPRGKQAWNAPFYAPYKQIGPWVFPTAFVNLMTLWLMSFILFIALANRLPERWGRVSKRA